MFWRLDGEGKVGAEDVFARRDLIAAANRVQLGWLQLEAMCHAPGRRTWALRATVMVDEITERGVGEGPPGGGGSRSRGEEAGHGWPRTRRWKREWVG